MITFFPAQDNNGTIENEELRGFLKDLLELVKKVRLRVNKYLAITLYYLLRLHARTRGALTLRNNLELKLYC